MPRAGRLHICGGLYHVIGRGLERRKVFNQGVDKLDFLDRLGSNLSRYHCQCIAWALMSNHYHLLIRTGADPLSRMMQALLGGYATSYNKRYGRSGYLFQNRFKSILCDEENYFLELVRYIHLNPLKADMVKDFNSLSYYPWTGHAGILGHKPYPWHNVDEVLVKFGTKFSSSRKAYLDFVKRGLNDNKDLSGGGLIRSYSAWESIRSYRKEHKLRIGDERILGERAFVEVSLKEDELKQSENTLLREFGWDLEKLIDTVCQHYAIDPGQITKKGRNNNLSHAKAAICHLAMTYLNISTSQIGRRLKISQPAVSIAARKAVIDKSSINKILKLGS